MTANKAVTATVTPGGSNTVGSITLPDAPDLSGTLWIDGSPSDNTCDQVNVRGNLPVAPHSTRASTRAPRPPTD
jgi:hypothetical protein